MEQLDEEESSLGQPAVGTHSVRDVHIYKTAALMLPDVRRSSFRVLLSAVRVGDSVVCDQQRGINYVHCPSFARVPSVPCVVKH